MDLEILRSELTTFADLGTDAPKFRSHRDRVSTSFYRNGELLHLTFDDRGDGKVEVRRGRDKSMIRPSYKALLATDLFADLGRWIQNQQRHLQSSANLNAIRVFGALGSSNERLDLTKFDTYLHKSREHEQMVRAVLIDGPAGIGKTKFIERLAFERAKGYRQTRRPLILHVQSRGRVLTFLQDLIATSLQILRLSVTFDQVPILARHGLVTIAIDGFDELGDPNGYDLAWNRVNELVEQIRGQGTLILAGRDTFIGRERIRTDIGELSDTDEIDSFSLLLPQPNVAKTYLKSQSAWPHSSDAEELLNDLLQPGSYALRPFFLSQLDGTAITSILDNANRKPLAFLINVMIDREAGKFGDAVDTDMDLGERRGFVRTLLREVARSMAEDQSETIVETVLEWMVDFAAAEFTQNEEVLRILKNRAMTLAFLENDEDVRHRRFPSSQISNHFLAEETVDRISENEVPKYIRRNILGADFLSAFSDLMFQMSGYEFDRVRVFFRQAQDIVQGYVGSDRTPRNLGSLLLVSLPAMGEDENLILEELDVDEALIEEVASVALLRLVTINQLDVRGANVSRFRFDNCSIHTLIADDATRLAPTIPSPAILRIQSRTGTSRTFSKPDEIRNWIDAHGGSLLSNVSSGLSLAEQFKNHDFVKVLERACRRKAFWIPTAGDGAMFKFAKHPNWPDVMEFLKDQDMGNEVVRGVGGRRPHFFRITNSDDILKLLWGTHNSKRKISTFHRALERAIADL